MTKRSTSNVAVAALRERRGVALVLTLAILALVTLLLIAFVASMRVENAASKNYNDLYKARELALGAIDQAVAQIRQATPSRALVGGVFQTNYVTYPGGAYVYTSSSGLASYSLFSGPTSTDQTNLNSGLWITGGTTSGEFLPTNSPNQFNVGWLYVDQNGNVGPAPLGSGQPLVGRIAYWVDDEASKINVNTAGVPPACSDPPYSACSTSIDVDLTMLLPNTFMNFGSIQTAAATQPFTTIEEIKRANPAITNVFDDNRFEVTAYSSDGNYPNYADDLDVFDRQKLPLNPTALNGTFATAVTELSDPNLATLYGSGSIGTPIAFASKYGGASGVQQIIANIIGYQADLNTTWPPDGGGSPPTYLGLSNSPLINEVQIQYLVTPGVSPNPATVQRTVSVELYFMYNGAYRTGSEQIQLSGLPTVGGVFSSNATISIPLGKTLIGGIPGTASAYYVPSPPYSDSGTLSLSVPNPITEGSTVQITYSRSGNRLNFAQVTLPRSQLFSTGGTVYQGGQVTGDPALNVEPADWVQYTLASQATLGSQNTGFSPPADSSLVSTSKCVMRHGPMLSVGELGFIHLPPDPTLTYAWRHLTLQPQPAAERTAKLIPDWAMLDIFTVGQGTAGRININSWINPSLAGNPTPATFRLVPLKALLNGAGVGAGSLQSIAQNIYEDQVTDRGTLDTYGMSNGRFGIFDTIGEICEIPSLGNSAATQAGLEATIRRIANLITVRSNTFTIWVMAQSIKQPPGSTFGTYNPPPTGPDLITGEVRAQAVVERYENPPGSAPKYRLRYIRYL